MKKLMNDISCVILLLIFAAGCSYKTKEKYDGNIRAQTQHGTGILFGNFELLGSWKDKKIIFYLTDSSNTKLVAYDTATTSGKVLIKSLSAGNYFLDARENIPLTKENVLLHYIGGTTISRDNCELVSVSIKKDTITVVESQAMIDKSAIEFYNRPDPGGIIDSNREVVKVHKPILKKICNLDSKYVKLADSTYNYYLLLKQEK